jgi:Mn-dependent DtxR family transcriptional regulator
VRVVRVADLAAEIAGREHAMDPSTARRVAESLGRVLRSDAGASEEP